MPRQVGMRLFWWGFVISHLAFAAGCGSRESTYHSVSGKVLVNGAPADRAVVCLTPLHDSLCRPMAVVKEDGSFHISGRDGAPAGEFNVTIVWPQYEIIDGEEVQLEDRLGGRYYNPATYAKKVTIHEGNNDLELFELQLP